MKKKSFSIRIDNRCHEVNTTMPDTDQGKYCTTCATEVIDFSKLSDRQLIELIQSKNPPKCGRFRKDQLEKVYTIGKPRFVLAKVAATLTGLALLGTVEGQKTMESNQGPQGNLYGRDIAIERPVNSNTQEKADTVKTLGFIHGKVLDSDGRTPVSYATIWIVNMNNISVSSRLDGIFEVRVTEQPMPEEIQVRVSAFGYKDKHLTIRRNHLMRMKNGVVIKLETDELHLIDGLMIID